MRWRWLTAPLAAERAVDELVDLFRGQDVGKELTRAGRSPERPARGEIPDRFRLQDSTLCGRECDSARFAALSELRSHVSRGALASYCAEGLAETISKHPSAFAVFPRTKSMLQLLDAASDKMRSNEARHAGRLDPGATREGRCDDSGVPPDGHRTAGAGREDLGVPDLRERDELVCRISAVQRAGSERSTDDPTHSPRVAVGRRSSRPSSSIARHRRPRELRPSRERQVPPQVDVSRRPPG